MCNSSGASKDRTKLPYRPVAVTRMGRRHRGEFRLTSKLSDKHEVSKLNERGYESEGAEVETTPTL